jgi:hypothetical protein
MDGVILTLAQEGASVGCDICSGETSVWMFCKLGKAVKNYVISSVRTPKEVYDGQHGDF